MSHAGLYEHQEARTPHGGLYRLQKAFNSQTGIYRGLVSYAGLYKLRGHFFLTCWSIYTPGRLYLSWWSI